MARGVEENQINEQQRVSNNVLGDYVIWKLPVFNRNITKAQSKCGIRLVGMGYHFAWQV
jgi:hypothetical protein